MPCDTVQVNRIVLEYMDHDLMVEALKAMGANVHEYTTYTNFTYQGQAYTIYKNKGKLESTAPRATVQATASELAVNYSEQVVLYTAERTGFTVLRTGKHKFKLKRRQY